MDARTIAQPALVTGATGFIGRVEDRVKSSLTEVAVTVEPLARRIHALRGNHIFERALRNRHGFGKRDQLIDIVGVKK